MGDLKFLINKRGHLRGQVTKLCDNINQNLGSMNKNTKITNLTKLEKLGPELNSLDSEIASATWKDSKEDDSKLVQDLDTFNYMMIK